MPWLWLLVEGFLLWLLVEGLLLWLLVEGLLLWLLWLSFSLLSTAVCADAALVQNILSAPYVPCGLSIQLFRVKS